jgi:asparaginyl-tRNA synthetase
MFEFGEPTGGWSSASFMSSLTSLWYRNILRLQDSVVRATYAFGSSAGATAMTLPFTTRTVTCPSGLGSDAAPVAVRVGDVPTYLSDSAQFLLEYGVRLARGPCYTVMPSARLDVPDNAHLSQFTHCEFEIPGALEDLLAFAERYVRSLVDSVLAEHEESALIPNSAAERLVRLSQGAAFARITFAEARAFLESGTGGTRLFTREDEADLMDEFGSPLWVTHFPDMLVPFYQGRSDDGETALNADLLMGIGEVIGAGERCADAEQLSAALERHGVRASDYSWYSRMRDQVKMQTSGFGMGIERFILWILSHDDIRDVSIVPRINESTEWPASVDYP